MQVASCERSPDSPAVTNARTGIRTSEECAKDVMEIEAAVLPLIAKGFRDPLGLHPKEKEIPAAYWKFLKFSGDYKEAAGKGIKYTGIEIARNQWL